MTPQIEQHLKANMNMTKKQIMTANFLGGLAWGLGTAVGAGVIVALAGWILNSFGFFDFFKQLEAIPQLYGR